MIRKLFYNARIYTPQDPGFPLCGPDQGQIFCWEKGALLTRDGLIHDVGAEQDVLANLKSTELDLEYDCQGACLIPGFVDPHTHMCFARRREEEFSMRISGTDYMQILKYGGGILSSVRSVRRASEDELYQVAMGHAQAALKLGTTTLEIKSGYGLDTHNELKMLRVIDRVGKGSVQTVIPTFLGAHVIPEEYKDAADQFVDLLIEEMLPAVMDQGIARFCDVFCEKNVFSINQGRRILQAAKKAGLKLKIHADEINDLGGAGLAAELQATSAEHLLAAGEENLAAMAAKSVLAVVLPATAYSLKKKYARARKMIELKTPLALATDCNPGSSYSESMPFVFGLAVMNMDMQVNEALSAATLNAAYALDQADQVGSLERGKLADFLILDGESPAILAYHAGVSPVMQVFKKGERVA